MAGSLHIVPATAADLYLDSQRFICKTYIVENFYYIVIKPIAKRLLLIAKNLCENDLIH